MKKTFIASAIGLALASAFSVQAQTITITVLKFGGSFGVAGTMNSNGSGSLQTNDNFFGSSNLIDFVHQQNWFDTHSSTLTWSGTGTQYNNSNAIGDFTYTFHLESNQVAVGTFWDWNTGTTGSNIPVLTIYDCPVTGPGACTGESLPMVTGPFLGSAPEFNGTTNDDFPISGVVPVPAAVWLMGSGLIGLIGVARRKKLLLSEE